MRIGKDGRIERDLTCHEREIIENERRLMIEGQEMFLELTKDLRKKLPVKKQYISISPNHDCIQEYFRDNNHD